MKEVRRKLRKNQTDAESTIWNQLRDRRFFNLKFRRQHDIGRFIVDFCCVEKGLVIEIDGGQHAERRLLDQERTEYLNLCGYQVLRFWNHEVLNQLDAVVEKIRMSLNSPHPNPLPGGAREFV